MPFEMRQCKITVLKKTLHQDLIDEYLDDEYQQDVGPCEQFSEGQEFIIDPSTVPEDFCACCPWAWTDIRNDITTIAVGGDIPGMRQGGTTITGCRDWFRPVLFKIERLEK